MTSPDGGVREPDFIYGTAWKEDETKELTKLALQTGFRAIDTANQRKHYHEEGVGAALSETFEEGVLGREDLFVQTKFTYERGQDHRLPYDPDASYGKQVEQSLDSSLDHLETDYVDSLILHGPYSRSGLADPDREVWEMFQELLQTENVRSIGVSNVTTDQLKEFLELSENPPAFVQNRCFARTGWDQATREVCDINNIGYQGFSLLTANQRELQSDIVRELAQRYDKTIPQIIFRFAKQVGMIPLTGTTDETHMKHDLSCDEFDMETDELRSIETLAV